MEEEINNKPTEDELFEYYQDDLKEDFKLDKLKIVKKNKYKIIEGLACDFNDKTDNTDWENVVMGISKEINNSTLIPMIIFHKNER